LASSIGTAPPISPYPSPKVPPSPTNMNLALVCLRQQDNNFPSLLQPYNLASQARIYSSRPEVTTTTSPKNSRMERQQPSYGRSHQRLVIMHIKSPGEDTSEWWSGSLARSLPSFRLPASVSLFLSWKFEAERVSTACAALYCMAGPAHPPRALSLGTSEVSSRQQQVLLRPEARAAGR
jgi:hypothetical protein